MSGRGGVVLRLSGSSMTGGLSLFESSSAFVTAVGSPGVVVINSGSSLRLSGGTGVEAVAGNGSVVVVSAPNTCRTTGTGVCQ